MESFLIGALSCLVLGCVAFLFAKPRKKAHLYIQNVVLIFLAVFCLFVLIFCSIDLAVEFPALLILNMITIAVAEFFIIRKLIKNKKLLEAGDIEE